MKRTDCALDEEMRDDDSESRIVKAAATPPCPATREECLYV